MKSSAIVRFSRGNSPASIRLKLNHGHDISGRMFVEDDLAGLGARQPEQLVFLKLMDESVESGLITIVQTR